MIICDEQIGFKKACRASDHILSLKTLIDKVFKKPKYLYCCFIDLRKAFDIVNRTALFVKLSKYNIQGNFLKVLKNMYNDVYYSVKFPEGLTRKISSTVGLKQGCILSPTLFSLYINDPVECLIVHAILLSYRIGNCLVCCMQMILSFSL